MNHLRRRNVAVAVCGVGSMIWVAALAQTGTAFAASEAGKSVMALAALGAVFGLVAALMFAIPAAGESRVRSGRDVIARWRVDATRWAAFAACDRALAADASLPSQRVKVTRRALAEGADVVIGKAGMLVGNDYWTLGSGCMVVAGLRLGPPLSIEFQFDVVTGEGPDVAYRLSVPAAHDNDPKAGDVVAVHDNLLRLARARVAGARPGWVLRDPRQARSACLWALALCLASIAYGGAAILQKTAQPLDGLLLGGGILFGLGAGVLALVAHFAAGRVDG